jgi:hypothetical protein
MKMIFGSISFITILYLVTGTDLEIFFILIFLGLFIMKKLPTTTFQHHLEYE